MPSFPIVIANLSDKDIVRFARFVETAEHAKSQGIIANPVYKDIKEGLNRLLERAWDKAISEPYVYAGKYESLPQPVHELSYSISRPALHNISSILNRINKSKLSHPMIDDMRAFLTEIAPLQTLFDELKPMISKRAPKSPDAVDPRYVAPKVSTDASKRVYKLLTDLMADSFDGLVQAFVTGMNGQLKAFKRELMLNPKTNLYNYAKKERGADINFLSRVTTGEGYPEILKISDDADETILSLATKDAEEIREMFVAKNLRKIVSIMDAKENSGVALTDVHVKSRHISLGGMTGEFHAAFEDGSSFDFTNSVVWSQSVHGKTFNRFPLNFHNVKLAGGVKMPRPSEERMNTVFVGKEG